MNMTEKCKQYARLIRFDKPIGTLLLLWPTWWALWLASNGHPNLKILFVFTAGVFLMRSAGCIMNDIADRHIDGHVTRTQLRPLAARTILVKEALFLAALFALTAFSLVLMCNTFTIYLSFIGAALAIIYPYLKRITHLPQLGLGVAFAWGVPMAFAAEMNFIPGSAWFVFATAIIWPIIYDTMYAMVDRPDDKKIGVKSTAILFGHYDVLIITLLECLFVSMLIFVGILFQLTWIYYASLVIATSLFIYQYYLIRSREPTNCFAAFLNNHWVGFIIFAGIFLGK